MLGVDSVVSYGFRTRDSSEKAAEHVSPAGAVLGSLAGIWLLVCVFVTIGLQIRTDGTGGSEV